MKHLIIIITISIVSAATSVSTYNPSKLPLNAKTLSMMGFGVASDYNNWINPASMSYNKSQLFEFSQNDWIFDDVSGASLGYRFGSQSVSYHYWKIDDIYLYGDVPSDAPEGSLSTESLFLQYSKSFNIKEHSFGFNLAGKYMNFFDLETKGLNIDFGYQKKIGNYLKLGVSIKNVYSDDSNSEQLPKIFIIGTKQEFNKIPMVLYFDLFHDGANGSGSFQAVKFKSSQFSIVCGVKYLEDFKSTDISLGVNFNWDNFELSISTLLPDNNSFKAPVFYQISYLF